MKVATVVLVAVTAFSSSAFAQSRTRAEVYQELVQAQHDGRDYVTDTSYPDVNPIFAHQLAQQQKTRLALKPAETQEPRSTATTTSAAN